jgi:hypothetical protein
MAQHFAGVAAAAETEYGSRLPEVVSERPPAGWARDHPLIIELRGGIRTSAGCGLAEKAVRRLPGQSRWQKKQSAGMETKFMPFR